MNCAAAGETLRQTATSVNAAKCQTTVKEVRKLPRMPTPIDETQCQRQSAVAAA
jgi:hypothetical protein